MSKIANIKFISFLALITLVCSLAAMSAPALDRPFQVKQPDGSEFTAITEGDEWANITRTKDTELPVALNKETQYWEYAILDRSSGLKPGGRRVGIDPPGNASKVALSQLISSKPEALARRIEKPASRSASLNVTGSVKTVVVMVQFANRNLTQTNPATWANLFFLSSGSVKAYYNEASNGKLSLEPAAESQGTTNDGIIVITLGINHPNTGGYLGSVNEQTLKDSLTAINSYINFESFDTDYNGYITSNELLLYTIWAGFESAYSSASPQVWAHYSCLGFPGETLLTLDGVQLGVCAADGKAGGYLQSGELFDSGSTPTIATIGTMAHEIGHAFGLPDLYDRDRSSRGLGKWSIMSGGSWNYTNYDTPGHMPAHFDPWSSSRLGWITPSKITSYNSSLTVPVFSSASSPSYGVFQFLDNPGGVEEGSSGIGEYFLVENRQKTGFDSGLPGAGLLIWHIDETVDGNDYEWRKMVDLEEADDDNDLDLSLNSGDSGDPYYAGNNENFTPTSSPSSNLNSGSASVVRITNISASSYSMAITTSMDDSEVSQSGWSPSSGSTLNTTSPLITLTTSENADCRWSLNDSSYSQMTGDCSGDGTMSQRCGVHGLSPGPVSLYIACKDLAGNMNSASTNKKLDYTISLSPSTSTINVYKGWNLVGVSNQGASFQIADVFDNRSVFDIGTLSEGHLRQMTDQKPLNLTFTGGYWIYMDDDIGEITVGGSSYSNTSKTISLTAGWNIFSIPFSEPILWQDSKAILSCGSLPGIFGFNNTTQEYENILPNKGTLIYPWKGYLISVASPCMLTLYQ